jgi:cobyrinic acid a,c-diamide synthase
MSRMFISAAHKSSGKTTISIGLCAAFNQNGLNIQPFKKGPDYIDPMWLGQAAGHPCHNLDFYTMTHDEIAASFWHYAHTADISLIEGNKGLYDGLDLDGSNSNAALSKLLQAPVILVIDARGMTRGIAPLIQGYQQFDKDVRIAGVILNQLGGHRHEQKLRAVIEHYTDVPVVGAVYRDTNLEIVERHLGLMPSNESDTAREKIQQLGRTIAAQVDLEQVIRIAHTAPILPDQTDIVTTEINQPDIRIGIARDAAFGFYYPDDLEAFEQAGAQLVFFDTLNDQQLPEIDGLFIGGGFPETQMQRLEQNQSMRSALQHAIENGLPCYAECGGLMYLARSIHWQGQRRQMVGVIPGDIVMHERPQGRGYIRLTATPQIPWPVNEHSEHVICGHEFHYSALENLPDDIVYAFNVKRGTGINGKYDGIVYKNLLANYAHLRNTRQSPWVHGFVNYVRKCKLQRNAR